MCPSGSGGGGSPTREEEPQNFGFVFIVGDPFDEKTVVRTRITFKAYTADTVSRLETLKRMILSYA